MARASGQAIPLGELMQGAMNVGLGETNLERRTLGVGNPTGPSRDVGRQNAVYASIRLFGGAGPKSFDVPHTLGVVPTSVELDRYENTTTPTTRLVMQHEAIRLWSRTACRVNLTATVGSLDGARAWFLIRGE